MLQRLFSSGGSGRSQATAPSDGSSGGQAPAAPPAPAAARSGKAPSPAAAMAELQRSVEKLRGYRDLAEDTLERAYARHVNNDPGEAAKLYRFGLRIIDEGLAVPLPPGVGGLGAGASNAAAYRRDMAQWQRTVRELLPGLEGGGSAGSTAAAAAAAGLPRRGVRPLMRPGAAPAAAAAAAAGRRPAGGAAAAAAGGSREDADFDSRVLSEVLDHASAVEWEDVAGLGAAKQALWEMVILPTWRADLFQGLRAPARGLLLYGPPGNGKTLLARALAHAAAATFFNISAASLTSRWHGDAEKLVRALFRVAARCQPAIIFIDEIDSVLSERSSGEHEASRRLKTEFLVQFDGVASGSDRLVVMGATNRPWDLDDAVRRRLPKRIYVPLPDGEGRRAIVQHLLRGQKHALGGRDLDRVVAATDGYSGSDLAALCKEAAMVPLRELGPGIADTPADQVRAIRASDFTTAAAAIKPSVGREQLRRFETWTKDYGMPS